jgi:hypothetical protein
VNDIAPEAPVYVDKLDPHNNRLHISRVNASTYDGTTPVVSLAITSDVGCDEDDNIIYIRLADVDHVIGMIRAAAQEATDADPQTAACECAQLAEKYRPCSACNPYTPPADPVLAGADWLEGIGQDHAASMLRAWHNGDFGPAAQEAAEQERP